MNKSLLCHNVFKNYINVSSAAGLSYVGKGELYIQYGDHDRPKYRSTSTFGFKKSQCLSENRIYYVDLKIPITFLETPHTCEMRHSKGSNSG